MTTSSAVITGAGSGIGLALAKQCAKRNIQLMLVDKCAERLQVAKQLLCDQTKVATHCCDVSHAEQVAEMHAITQQQLGTPHYLFNNAGIFGPIGPLWMLSPEDVAFTYSVNVHSMLLCCHHFIPAMLESNNSCTIINTASTAAFRNQANLGSYCITKQAVVSLSEAMRDDLKQSGHNNVRICVLCPGITQTQIDQSIIKPNGCGSRIDRAVNYLQKLQQLGLAADEVAERAWTGIENGDFIIQTSET